jgi:hypothetical protein
MWLRRECGWLITTTADTVAAVQQGIEDAGCSGSGLILNPHAQRRIQPDAVP